MIGSGDNESRGSGARELLPPRPPPAHARGMVSEASVAHFGYLSRYTIPPARAEEGPPGPGRSRPVCNQCSPDLIPCRTHPTGSRGPGRDNSRPARRPRIVRERQTQAPTEQPRRSGAQGPRRASGKGAKFTSRFARCGQVEEGLGHTEGEGEGEPEKLRR